MSLRIAVKPELLRWACERSGRDLNALNERFEKLPLWLSGQAQPTLKQLEELAKATYTPFGYFFLPAPLDERVPIPDFRTMAGKGAGRPSPNLLEMIYICQQRQDWYRDFARSMGEKPLAFVGSAKLGDDVVDTARKIRDALGFSLETHWRAPTWSDALRSFIACADDAGMLVMCSGVVLNNNTRKLDPEEFRGFALSDPLAPLVFINGSDTKGAQMFTLAHELAHVWLGESGVFDPVAGREPDHKVEQWCNRVAAELLVPLDALRVEYKPASPLPAEIERLARRFKVSTLVILRRIHDAGGLSWDALWEAYETELARILARPSGSGGNFHLTTAARVSKRFARALVISTWEGRSSFTEAFSLLGIKKVETFRGLSDSLGMAI